MKRWHKFTQLPASSRLILLESVILLGLTRLAVLIVPFRLIQPFLRSDLRQSSKASTSKKVEQIRYSIAAASNFLPWRNVCLNQAITAKLMLNRRGLPNTLVLGVQSQSDQLAAHAWVCVGEKIVIGEKSYQDYQPILSVT
jgi:hypothetical protein